MDPSNAGLTGEDKAAASMICPSEANMENQRDFLKETEDPILGSSKEAEPVPSSLAVA